MENQKGNSSSRLMITKMSFENFKSYAGSQEIGPLHKSFTCIVGPNGSGKSNVIDGLLFVFGKKAKQLRLNKVSELIHKSSRFPNLDYTKVSVHFQLIIDNDPNTDNFEVVPGSELVVTRTAYLNNSSKYTVNDKVSTYTEVGLLLRSHGIDLDNNRFLILQGEVEQIAMMKPKAVGPHEEGLLEYLEDIIGSNRFVEQIETASKELDALNEQRTEKVNRLKVAEKERDNLSGSKVEAEAYMEKDKVIRRKKNELYQILETQEAINVADLRSRYEQNNEKLAAAKTKLKESERSFVLMEKTYESTKADYNAIDSELQRSQAEFGAFERRDVKLQEDMAHLRSQVKKQQATVAKESKREQDCIRDADKALEEAETSRKSVVEVQGKKEAEEAALQEIMDGLREATKELRDKLEGSQVELAAAERAVSGLSTEKEAVAMGQKLIRGRVETVRKNTEEAESRLTQIAQEKVAHNKSLLERDQEKKQLEKRRVGVQSNIQSASDDEIKAQESLKSAISAAEEARAQLSSQQSQGSHSKVATAILKAAKKGGALSSAGVLGRLGDLATISPEYDVAISTACGSLDYIVCETLEGCEKCVKFLRDTNAGRASFIALSQMDQWKGRMEKKVVTPNNTPRLFDLIRPSAANLLPAFYFALKDTLVASDLETAVKIAYQGDRAMWRVVTMDGNLIDTSGAMSGGGKEGKSGGMLLSSGAAARPTGQQQEEEVSAAQLQKLDAEVSRLQNQLTTARNGKAGAETELKGIEQRLKAIDLEVSKMQLSIKHLDEQTVEITDRLVALRAESSLTEAEKAELQDLEVRMAAVDREIESSSPQLGALRSTVAALQRKILDVGGPKLSRAQAKVDILSKQFDALSATLSTKEVEETNLRKQAVKAASICTKSEEDIVQMQEKLKALLKEQEDMENDAVKVNEAIEGAKQRMTEQDELLKKITDEFNALKSSVEKTKGAEVDLAEEIKNFGKTIKEGTQKLDQIRRNLETLRKTHVDEQREFNAAVSDVLKTKKAAPSSGSAEGETEAEPEAMQADLEVDELPVLDAEKLEELVHDKRHRDELTGRITLLEEERDKMKGSVNMNALMEYLRKDAGYRSRLNELELITEERNARRRDYEGLRRQRLEEFMAGFGTITLKLKEMYQMITLGGDAELELVDSLDPFSEGIVFSVRPPKKSWKNISNLSGGEKTLSSLALVFALHHFKPTPLYVMDEIDAALDFKNVSIVANYIKERTKNAQFVIISLRNNMFELADRLVGIYKTHDATKSVTINPKLFAAMPTPASGNQNSYALAQQVSNGSKSVFPSQNNASGSALGEEGESEAGGSGGASEPPLKLGRRAVLADTTNLH